MNLCVTSTFTLPLQFWTLPMPYSKVKLETKDDKSVSLFIRTLVYMRISFIYLNTLYLKCAQIGDTLCDLLKYLHRNSEPWV